MILAWKQSSMSLQYFSWSKSYKFSKNINTYCPLRFSNCTRHPVTLPPMWSGGVRHWIPRTKPMRAISILQGAWCSVCTMSTTSIEVFPKCIPLCLSLIIWSWHLPRFPLHCSIPIPSMYASLCQRGSSQSNFLMDSVPFGADQSSLLVH